MAADAPRRSGRARKPVIHYADQQAAEQAEVRTVTAAKLPARSKGRKAAGSASASAKPPTARKRKAAVVEADDDADDGVSDGDSLKKKASKGKAKDMKPKADDTSGHESAADRRIEINQSRVTKLRPGEKEARLRPYVATPPNRFYEMLERANTQRMFVIDRERGIEDDCHAGHADCPNEIMQLAGSTGNVYTVTISHLPSCTCQVGTFTRKGQEFCCKHILYVLSNVLKASDHLKRQNAFLAAELKDVFTNAPALPAEIAEDSGDMDGNRKPAEDDCPICCMAFEDGEDIVWCRATCGNNIHTACFSQWAKMKHENVTCPFCRSVWEDEKTAA